MNRWYKYRAPDGSEVTLDMPDHLIGPHVIRVINWRGSREWWECPQVSYGTSATPDAPDTPDDPSALADLVEDWRQRALDFERERNQATVRAEQAEARVADYENRISWDVTCGNCARLLDASIRDHERADRAEAILARVTLLCDEADHSPESGIRSLVHTRDVRALLEGVPDPGEPTVHRNGGIDERKIAVVNNYPWVSDREQTCVYPWCEDPRIEAGSFYATATVDDVHGKMHLRHTDQVRRKVEQQKPARTWRDRVRRAGARALWRAMVWLYDGDPARARDAMIGKAMRRHPDYDETTAAAKVDEALARWSR